MKWWRILLIAGAAILIFVVADHWYEKRAQAKRDASYQATLRTYSQQFHPGLTRKTVEDYFRANGVRFRQESGPGSLDALSDSVVIGHDTALVPFPCSSWETYIAFHFASEGKHDRLESDNSDVLRQVQLQSSGDCV